MIRTISGWLGLALLAAAVSGCPDEDDRVAQLAVEAANRQAAQNQELAQLNREVAEGTRRLIESDGQSRAEFAKAQRELQAQQSAVADQFNLLESERKTAAVARMREPLLAAALTGATTLLVACLPLAVALYLLRRHQADETDPAALSELLISELASDRPVLLPPAPEPTHPCIGVANTDRDGPNTAA
jgi:hypothetical protein